MSLARLLAAGRSLVGMKEGLSPYRLTHQRLLPKFDSARNPFRAQSRPEEERPPAVETTPPPSVTRDESTSAKAKAPDRAKDGAQERPAPAKPIAPRSSPTKLAVLARGWLRPSGRQATSPKPVKGSAPARPVQTELSLDSVQVVRNDLSDADWQVVAAKPAISAPPVVTTKPAAAPAAKTGAGEPGAWTRATRRLFGVSK